MKKSRKLPVVQIVMALILIAVIVTPFIINESYKRNNGYVTVWDGDVVLAYCGASFSAIGTIILGWIAWNQNARLLKLEENSFLAANSSSALLTDITITKVNSISVNFHNHPEQILKTQNVGTIKTPLDYGSIEIICRIVPFSSKQHIALVNVESVLLVAESGLDKSQVFLSAVNADKQFSRVAISNEYDSFKITVIMSKQEKDQFITAINNFYSSIMAEMEFVLMTDKYVATELKCRAKLGNPDYDESDRIYSHFKNGISNPPICFWQGAYVVEESNVMIKDIQKYRKN